MGNETYIIGEIGQNHNGSVDLAKVIIDLAHRPVMDDLFGTQLRGLDAVKLTKRDLDYELTDSANSRPYDSPNSFGKTYGQHRRVLELDDEQHFEVYKYAKEKGLDFVETLCAPSCLSILKLFKPDKLKVASRDLTNIPLLSALAETKIPMIVSTGMAGKEELDAAVDTITRYHSDLSILHCLSQYPSEYENLNLNTIHYLQEEYSDFTIGYSDHSVGIFIPVAAVAMGAKIIEKHITIDRNMKGTDQKGSLGPDGLNRMVRDIRLLDNSFGEKNISIASAVQSAKTKLERSLATNCELKAGQVISESMLHLLSPGDGYSYNDMSSIVGKVSKVDIAANEIIYPSMIK